MRPHRLGGRFFPIRRAGVLSKGQNIDRLVKYKPARETLTTSRYRVDLSTGPLRPPLGKCQHVGLAAVYEHRGGGVRRIPHGIDNVHGRTREEALRRMKEAILQWLDAQESPKKRRPKG